MVNGHMVPYAWPVPPGQTEPPRWTGQGFQLCDTLTPVLSYAAGRSATTDAPTAFYAEAGATHFMDRASRRRALGQLCRYVSRERPVILDAGCSFGFMVREIRAQFPNALVIGSDVAREPLDELARHTTDVPLLQFDLVTCPLPETSVDAVLLLNVLEHIDDERSALRQLYRILKPGGVLVIEVPAGPDLYDVFDRLLQHHRRYTLAGLCGLLEETHFRILNQSHLGCLVYPGFWLVKRRNRRFLSERSAARIQRVTENIRYAKSSRLVHGIMCAELRLGAHLSYPFGIRCLVTCAK